jgi:hypothetical protein
MKSTIGVYDNHEQAVAAVKELKAAGFNTKHVSILGHAHDPEEREHEEAKVSNLAATEVGLGATLGTAAGILTGIGVFAIPGLGLLYGAGALVGALVGFDLGLIGGGILSALSIGGLKDEHNKKYDALLQDGKFLVIVHGDGADVKRANDVLHSHGTHSELNMH